MDEKIIEEEEKENDKSDVEGKDQKQERMSDGEGKDQKQEHGMNSYS